VVSYAVLGHSLKYIAYELGLAISTVSGNLGTAMRKLGVASRAELVRLFAGGAPSAQ
jgi:DNA-binding CsgD family transcriptional regulator